MSSLIFEITHDSLAAKIWEKVSAEEKTLIEVKNFITTSAAIYKTRRVLLTKQDLAYIAPYENKLAFDHETFAFINRSKRFYRNRKISTISMIVVIIAGLIIGIFVIDRANRKAVGEKENAEREKVRAIKAETNAVKEKENAEKEKIRAVEAETNAVKEKENAEKEKTRAVEAEKKALALKSEADKATMSANSLYNELKTQEESRKTLANKLGIAENPTLALKEAVDLYDSFEHNDLKDSLKKNVFRAFNEMIYVRQQNFHTVQNIAVAYNGKTILIADSTNIPKVWNIEDNTIRNLLGHFGIVTFVAAAPDKAHFVTVENKRETIFWNGNYEYLDTANYKDEIIAINYVNEGNNLLIGFKNGKLAIADLKGKIKTWINDQNITNLQEIIVSQKKDYNFITRSDNKIIVWKNGIAGEFENNVLLNDNKSIGKIASMAISPDGEQLYLATDKGIFCDHSFSLVKTSHEFHSEINLSATKIAFKSNRELIVSTAVGDCFIYDLDRKESIQVKGYVNGAKITELKDFPNDNRFITVGKNASIKIWDGEAGKLFFSSVENKPDEVVNNPDKENNAALILNKKTGQWNLNISGNTVYFKNRNDNGMRRSNLGTNAVLYWDSAYYQTNLIKINSPGIKYGEMYSSDSVRIYENTTLLNSIKISDLARNNKKMRSKLNIKTVVISDCKKYILIKCIDRDARYTYYFVYPTFLGIYDMVKNNNLLKIEE